MTREGSITIGFDNQAIEIGFNNHRSFELVDYLCLDLPRQADVSPYARLDVVCAGKKPMLSLWKGNKKCYFGESFYKLSYMLVNEIIYHCIVKNKTQHAIHAGAVHVARRGIILPGKSGSGKSTLTAWLLSKNFGYLSDELILLSADGHINPFTRPLSFKTNHLDLFVEPLMGQRGEIISDDHGSMIPHRLFNPHFTHERPLLTHIIFPEFRKNAPIEVSGLSPGKSLQMLMESYINARNFPGIGLQSLSRLVRQSKSYKLVYGGFTGMEEVLYTLLGR